MNPSLTESKEENDHDEDRISDLPDALIHHIFSFLDMRDVVGTSFLSNRWKTLWLSTPTLNFSLNLCFNCEDNWDFDDDDDDLCKLCPIWKKNFKDFVDRFFIFRGNNNIDKFNLSCIDAKVDKFRVHTWLLAALEKKTCHLILKVDCCGVSYKKPWILPHKLFASNITVLKLNFYLGFGSKARLPSSICTALRIKILELHSIGFPDGNANGELILSCPVLETLSITRCDLSNIETFILSTPKLESLEFISLYTTNDKSCRVKTTTPNLKMIKVEVDSLYQDISKDISIVDYCLESLTSLVSAEVDFHCSSVPNRAYSECLIKVLNGIHNVQSLKLANVSLQLLTDFPESMEKLSDMFSNLKYVMIVVGSPSVHAVLSFLERFSHIENLVWERHPREVGFGWHLPREGETWVDVPFQRIFNCLKTFEIRNFQGFEIELKVLEFLLHRAVVLEDMIINTSQPCLLVEKLQSLPRASSSAAISFKQSCRANTLEDLRRSLNEQFWN